MNIFIHKLIIDDCVSNIEVVDKDSYKHITISNLNWDAKFKIINKIENDKSIRSTNHLYIINGISFSIRNISTKCLELIYEILYKDFNSQMENLILEFLLQTKDIDYYLNNNDEMIEAVLMSAAFHKFYCDEWRELALKFEFKKDRILDFLKQIENMTM